MGARSDWNHHLRGWTTLPLVLGASVLLGACGSSPSGSAPPVDTGRGAETTTAAIAETVEPSTPGTATTDQQPPVTDAGGDAASPSEAFLARMQEDHPEFELQRLPATEACGLLELRVKRAGRSLNAFRESAEACERVRLKSTVPLESGATTHERLQYVNVRFHSPEAAVEHWELLAEQGAGDTGLSYAFDYVAVRGNTLHWLYVDACAFEGAYRAARPLLEQELQRGGVTLDHVLSCTCGLPCKPATAAP